MFPGYSPYKKRLISDTSHNHKDREPSVHRELADKSRLGIQAMCALRYQPPLKNITTLFLAKSPPLNLQNVQGAPFLGNPPSILVFREPHPI